MKKDESFYKSLKIFNNGAEISIQIEIKDSLSIKAKSSLNPLLQWTYIANQEQINKAFPILSGCESLIEIADFIVESIGNKEYSLENNDMGLVLVIDFKPFRKKLKFFLNLNEIKDQTAMLIEMNQVIMKLNANLPKSLYQSSEILQNDEFETIRAWIDPLKKIKLTLLYQGKDDSFSGSVFHTKCNDKATTLTLVKSHLDFRFGGFTNVPWDSSNNYKKDSNAFVFSLTRKLKFKENGANNNSIYCYGTYGPTFGGNDFLIADNCAANFTSSSKLGINYSKEGTENMLPEMILAGNPNFFVKAIEVYQVQFV